MRSLLRVAAVSAAFVLLLPTPGLLAQESEGDAGAAGAERTARIPAVPAANRVAAEDPAYTPPRLLNPGQVALELARRYPRDLRVQGIGGAPVLRIQVGRTGQVESVSIEDPGGHRLFAEAALEVARSMRFTPAIVAGRERAVTVTLPARFEVELPAELRDLEVRPRPPAVANRPVIAALLTRHYPDYLRESGWEGRAVLDLVVDAEGRVWSVKLAETSGRLELDEIALTIGSFFEFEPGLEEGRPGASRVRVPVQFGDP